MIIVRDKHFPIEGKIHSFYDTSWSHKWSPQIQKICQLGNIHWLFGSEF